MITRTWPYGTKLAVEVSNATADYLLVIYDHGYKKEGFILFKHGMQCLPEIGSKGFIIFTKGGPTGGYWVFSQ